MKSIILTIMFCLLSAVAISQNNKRFNFKFNKEQNNYTVKPIFDQPVFKGKRGILNAGDQYLLNLFSKSVNEVFPKEKLSLLHKGNKYILNVNSDGEIFYGWFIINAEDLKVITEDDLYNLYNKFKQTKIDRSKIRILPGGYAYDKSLSYIDMVGNFTPVR